MLQLDDATVHEATLLCCKHPPLFESKSMPSPNLETPCERSSNYVKLRVLLALGRGARVAESDGLENRSRGNSTVGSNPTLSATQNWTNSSIFLSHLRMGKRFPHL